MQELKEMPIWVCWDRKEKNGRTTKVPCAATGGATGTDEKYRKTWVSYADAVSAAERDGHAGVGFVIPVGWFFLDLDHVGLDDPSEFILLIPPKTVNKEGYRSTAAQKMPGRSTNTAGSRS